MTTNPPTEIVADFTYSTEQAEADGAIIDMTAWGVRLFRDGYITHVTADLFAALQAQFLPAIEMGALQPWAVLGDLLARLTRPELVHDTSNADAGEPSGWLYATDGLALFGGRSIWLQRNDAGDRLDPGWTAMFPEDY